MTGRATTASARSSRARVAKVATHRPLLKGGLCPSCRAENRIDGQLAPFRVTPDFSGDPRGCTVKLAVPSGRTDDWGRTGICVPTATEFAPSPSRRALPRTFALGDKIMTTFQLSFGLDNASFADDPQTEIARILRTVADEIDSQRRTILDVGCIIRDSKMATMSAVAWSR